MVRRGVGCWALVSSSASLNLAVAQFLEWLTNQIRWQHLEVSSISRNRDDGEREIRRRDDLIGRDSNQRLHVEHFFVEKKKKNEILSNPNIMYFASTEYDYNQQEGVPVLLKGSAICTNRTWVPCPTCDPEKIVQKGAYPIERVVGQWYPAPNASGGSWLNVTDYLTWNSEPEMYLDTDNNEFTVNLTDLVEANIPEEYGISLNASHGYILNGVSVTGRLGYTPLDCLTADIQPNINVHGCFLDLYPFFYTGQDYADYFQETGETSLQGDVSWVYIAAALHNNCDGATLDQGFYNYGTVLIMILGTFYISHYIKKVEVEFDEDEQTAQDYSVVVENPPPDAHDPEEWKAFFEETFSSEVEDFKVTVCTVDVANKSLIRHLLQRREILKQLETELFLPPLSQGGTVAPLDLATVEQHIRQREAQSEEVSKRTKARLSKLTKVEALIRDHYRSGTKPPTTKVYLTFETEAAQRHVLSKLTVGKFRSRESIARNINSHYLFRGEHVLDVQEPEEPSTVRWQDLDVSELKMFLLRAATYMVTLVFMYVAYLAVRELYLNNQPWYASILVSIFTSTFPIIAKALVELERHHSETSRQRSLFYKICVFNVLVTTALLAVITPFQATLDKREFSLPGLIPAVYSLFYSQMVITPAIQLLDIGGNIKRHFSAPRAKTQHQMNMCMMGTQVHLAERYSNMIKFLFMTLWYCSIYPAAFFLGFISLMVTYFVDRFSLMRSWARCGQVGSEIAEFARTVVMPIAIACMSIVSAYFWSGFPYDNLCVDEEAELDQFYYGDWELRIAAEPLSISVAGFNYNLFQGESVSASLSVTPESKVYKYCNQDLRAMSASNFPALPDYQPPGDEWMTADQEIVVGFHGSTSVIVLILILAIFFFGYLSRVKRLLFGSYSPRGKDQGIPFSEVPAIDSYIPQIKSAMMVYPIILCNIDHIDRMLFNWSDVVRPHTYYDVTREIPTILGPTDYPDMFAKVHHWPNLSKSKADNPREANGNKFAGEVWYDCLEEDIVDEVSV